ncbi:MAG: hypothetical protein IIX86_00040 [Clostridia bacterium]|nr:hypothetical protein [Clostridia bacterium]
MKKERFFRLWGDLDDAILDKYRQIDLRLSHKAYRKKRTLRILAVAACLALLIGACVPVGVWLLGQGDGSQIDPPVPTVPEPSITLHSIEELDEMREMIACEDAQLLQAYLRSITGGGANDRQDLIDFVALVDSTPYAWVLQGEVTGLHYQNGTVKDTGEPYEVFNVSVQAENGDWVRCRYILSIKDVAAYMDKIKQEIGSGNLLPAPLSTADGRLTLHTETREPHASGTGDLITWWGELDGIVLEIAYHVAGADAVNTAALLETLKITETVDLMSLFPRYARANTLFGSFIDRPGYRIYAVADSPGNNFRQDEDTDWMYEEYRDPNAAQTLTVMYEGEKYVLSYEHSMPATYSRQARHIYKSGSVDVWVDAETGAIMRIWATSKNGEETALSKEELAQKAYDFFATLVYDPEAYSVEVEYFEKSGGAIVEFVRYVGDLPTCDTASFSLTKSGKIYSYVLDYLGAMRYAQPVPSSTLEWAEHSLESIIKEFVKGSYDIDELVLTPNGNLALACSVSVTYTDDDGMEWGDGAWMLFELTEPYTEKESDTVTPEPEPYDPEMNLPRIRYEWDDVEFGAFLEEPEYHVYHTNGLGAPEFVGYEVDIDILSKKYQDPEAPLTATVNVGGKEYVLSYTHSRTHGQETLVSPMLQAAHCYELYQDDVTYKAEMDQKTGACIAFSTEQGRLGWDPKYTVEQADEIAENLWQTVVPDFENYEMPKGYEHSDRCYYNEIISNWFVTCEDITIEIDLYNGAIDYRLNFLGAMRNAERIPESLINQIQDTLIAKFPSDSPHSLYNVMIERVVITEDGRLALDYEVYVPYVDPETQEETQDCLCMLIYLTEPMK